MLSTFQASIAEAVVLGGVQALTYPFRPQKKALLPTLDSICWLEWSQVLNSHAAGLLTGWHHILSNNGPYLNNIYILMYTSICIHIYIYMHMRMYKQLRAYVHIYIYSKQRISHVNEQIHDCICTYVNTCILAMLRRPCTSSSTWVLIVRAWLAAMRPGDSMAPSLSSRAATPIFMATTTT